MTFRRAIQYAIPLAAIVAIAALIAQGPLYRSFDHEQCLAAYSQARTRGDSARVDLHPYRTERDNRRVRHVCGEVRAVLATDSVPLVSRATP